MLQQHSSHLRENCQGTLEQGTPQKLKLATHLEVFSALELMLLGEAPPSLEARKEEKKKGSTL